MKFIYSLAVFGLSTLMAFHCNVATADIIFDMTSASTSLTDGIRNGDSVTSGGVTMTFDNVVVADGSIVGDVEDSGILISGTTDPSFADVISFDFSFDEDVTLVSYTLGSHEDVLADRSFTVAGNNGVSDANPIPEGTSFTNKTLLFGAGTIPVFVAGEQYSFSHNMDDSVDQLITLRSFTVAVPEPGTVGILMLAIVGLAVRRKRTPSC